MQMNFLSQLGDSSCLLTVMNYWDTWTGSVKQVILKTSVPHLRQQVMWCECSPLGGAIGQHSDSCAHSRNLLWFRNNDEYCWSWRVCFVILLFLPDLHVRMCVRECSFLLWRFLCYWSAFCLNMAVLLTFYFPLLTLCFPPKSLQHPLDEESSN